ncbi:MAG TPA: STELLO glycosyltransferase family protein [Pyrinomonadaceae bacterium]|nr:STELLO glycosyltransferase family protein [Pyrinomonadaceae bacterium]
MAENFALVVTSIAAPNWQLETWAKGCRENNYQFIVIGDEASPADFQLDGCRFYSLEDQSRTEFKLAGLAPTRHYARKNLGYLIAIQNGTNVIVETDDDNIPYEHFWGERERIQSVAALGDAYWVNVYRYFSEASIWPRGFPLECIANEPPSFSSLNVAQVDCPIQQGLANEHPDVDAIYRLISPGAQSFTPDRSVALKSGSWCPFNSQNTAWWKDAFPLLYLPSFCSFRMTDIWRSFVAQRVAWANDWAVLFESPTVWQERNTHDLMRDFKDEVPGYLNNKKIGEELGKLALRPGAETTADNMRSCYEQLIGMELIDRKELSLLEAWFEDLQTATEAANNSQSMRMPAVKNA